MFSLPAFPARFFHRQRQRRTPAVRPRLEMLERRELLSADGERFVMQLYRDMLQREAEPAGLQHWVQELDQGGSRLQVATNISLSPERLERTVEAAYQGYLLRASDAVGRQIFVTALANGVSMDEVRAAIFGSPEYFQSYPIAGDDSRFLSVLYQNVLGREVDSVGREEWGGRLARGESRTSVALRILQSPETDETVIRASYRHFLRREAEPEGLEHWLGLMRAGEPDLQVQAEIAASDEYFQLRPDPSGGSGGLIFGSFGSGGSLTAGSIFSSFGSITSDNRLGGGTFVFSNSASRVLTESTATFASQVTVPVASLGGVLNAPVGVALKLQFNIDAYFDTTDPTSAVEDTLLVYLVDSANPTQTLLDRGTPGTALMSLTAAGYEIAPDVVRYVNGFVEIDLSRLGSLTNAALVFQLLNFDSDTGTQASIGPVSLVSSPPPPNGSAPGSPIPSVPPGAPLDLSGLVMSSDLSLYVSNIRYADSTGTLTAEFQIASPGTTAVREAVVVFPSSVTVDGASGVNADGSSYVNFHNAIPLTGLEPGQASWPVELAFTKANDAPFPLHAQILVQPA